MWIKKLDNSDILPIKIIQRIPPMVASSPSSIWNYFLEGQTFAFPLSALQSSKLVVEGRRKDQKKEGEKAKGRQRWLGIFVLFIIFLLVFLTAGLGDVYTWAEREQRVDK